MKKIYFTTLLAFLVVLLGYAQSVPQGMNYQAVARDKFGKELINQQVLLKIALHDPQKTNTFYTETHVATTNEFGLFSLVIGEGAVESGTFAEIPWSTQEVWMSVSIQTQGQSDYSLVGSSKLYTVPYAFYAGSVVNPEKSLLTNTGQCPCNGGITTLSVLYLGPNGVTIRVYNNSGLINSGLVQTFTPVNNGAVLTIHVPANLGTLQSQTYFEYSGIPNAPAVTAIPTVCSSSYSATNPASPGGTWGNISVISQTDQNGQTCTACNVSGMWYVGGNAVLDACNKIGTLTNNDLVLISNNTPRMVVSANGDVTTNNNLNVNQGLNVLGNVKLNQSTGSTINNGPFTVANFSPTTLTGTLTTNGASLLNNTLTVGNVTDLNDKLNVNNRKPTWLTGSLTVLRETRLDSSLVVAGNSDLHGYLQVDNRSPAIFTGTLQGYEDATFNDHVLITNASINSSSTSTGALVVAGGTGIGQTLYVGGPSYLLNSLSVSGNTDLYGYLHVDNQSPTLLTGTLSDSLNATFFQHVTLPNAGLNSFTPGDGALLVAGGVGIGENLNVGGSASFGGPVNFKSIVTFSDTVNSTAYNNGTVIIAGGEGIARNLNVNGLTGLNSALTVFNAAPTNLTGTLNVIGNSTVTTLNASGNVIINSPGSGSHSDPHAYPLTVTGSNQGIRVQVNGAAAGTANFSNDYMQFVDNAGTPKGSITGETLADLWADDVYQEGLAVKGFLEALALRGLYQATSILTAETNREVVATNDVAVQTEKVTESAIKTEEDVNTEIGEDAATTPCVGFGVCETVPPVSMIVAGAANLIEDAVVDGMEADEEALEVADEVLVAANLTAAQLNRTLAATSAATATANLAAYIATRNARYANGGVYFNSNNGDYAEWLQKANTSEKIYRGDIVGVKGGVISKNTEGADKLMVVSVMPIILGNAPPKGEEANFEKVAFIGQVPVKVTGKVTAGDYILSTDGGEGFGTAKHPADMTAADYLKIVGTAWGSSNSTGVSYINTAVGLNNNDVAKLAVKQEAQLSTQEKEISELKKQMTDMNAALAKLVPGFNNAVPATSAPVASLPANSATSLNTDKGGAIPDAKRYLELTRDEFEAAFSIAKERLMKVVKNPERNPILKKMNEDPAYKEQMYSVMLTRSRNEIAKRVSLDKSGNR